MNWRLDRILFAPNDDKGGAEESTDGGADASSDAGTATPETPASESNEFSALSDFYEAGDEDVGGDGEGEETPAEETVAPTEPATPTEPAAPPPAPEPSAPTVQEPSAPGQAPAQAQQPDQAPVQAQPQLTPEQWQQQVQQWRDQAVDVLSKQVYQFSDEDFEAFETDPRQMLPKLAARVHIEAMQAAMMKTLELVPQVIQHQMAQQRTLSTFETEFYDKWPTLRQADPARIGQVIEVYRNSLNGRRPSRGELINEVGQLASAVLRIPFGEPTQQQPAQTAAPPPFQPAVAQQAPARAPAQPQNEFEKLFSQFESEELDL